MEMVYLHQGSTKSALSGVSPVSNRKIVKSYDLPTFIYGLDTIPVNKTDLDRLETKFRSVLRSLQSLPRMVATPAVYLTLGQLPAVAERDIEILGLLGQVAQCARELQAVTDIIEDGLTQYDIEFPGWSGLVRQTCVLYGLDDPLELIQQPWRADRWRLHCKTVVTEYWVTVLRKSCTTYSTLDLFDTARLRLDSAHPIWVAAGRDSVATSRATYVFWLLLGVYNTGDRLFKLKKAKDELCTLCCNSNNGVGPIEDRTHFLLSCPALSSTREDFLRQLTNLSPLVTKYMEVSEILLLCLLDPLSPRLPEDLRTSWVSEHDVYQLSRNFCYSMHKKRTKLMEAITETT